MHYVEVGIGVERHWKSAIFTYSSDDLLSVGDVVRVPFGKKKKAGVVLKIVSKPSFDTKSVHEKLPVSMSNNLQNFMKWFKGFYATADGELHSQFFPGYIGSAKKLQPTPSTSATHKVELNKSQERAVREIQSFRKPTVLQGVTGSGKTRVYLRLIEDCLRKKKNTLVLYPEIALTSQLVTELESVGRVLVFHSHMTTKQRSDLWLQVALATEPCIVAGPRSALFLPHKDLGLIVVDEAHEQSFKQENDVHYNGILVAGGLAKAHDAKLVLGSATPPLTETELVLQSGGSLVTLHEKAIDTTHEKHTSVINLKDASQFKRHHLISDKLLSSIQTSLSKKKQSLLFLNRRGTAKLLLCESCDWQATCENCDLPMTYHHDIHRLLCHTCDKRAAAPSSCPECGSDISIKSLGSKALVEEVQKLFPDARIGRFDSDTYKSESFSNQYNEIRKGSVDILIGTQQLAKGIDLPRLRTVGLLQADLSLNFPDYSSNERTFQLVTQVLGRVGRGHGEAEVLLQTHQPNNPTIQLAIAEDWQTFREHELTERKTHGFPPGQFTAKLISREKTFDKAYSLLNKLRKSIESKHTFIRIDGPLPSFYGKKGGFYYVQLHLRASKRGNLLAVCKDLPASVIKDLDPLTLL